MAFGSRASVRSRLAVLALLPLLVFGFSALAPFVAHHAIPSTGVALAPPAARGSALVPQPGRALTNAPREGASASVARLLRAGFGRWMFLPSSQRSSAAPWARSVTPIYPTSPAPMGIADFGVRNLSGTPAPYEYNTTSFEGSITVGSWDSFNPSAGNNYTIQLNAVLSNVTLFDARGYVFWLQNVIEVYPLQHQVQLVDNIWNFSSPTSVMGPSTIYSSSSPPLISDPLFAVRGPVLNLTPPYSLSLYLNSSVVGGRNAVLFNYSVPAKGVHGTYDEVVFNSTVAHGAAATLAPLEVNGFHLAPSNLLYDTELVLGGPGGGSTINIANLTGALSLQFLNGTHGFAPVPSAYDYGTDTGETSIGVSVYYVGRTAELSQGPSLLHGLWGSPTLPGFIVYSGRIVPSTAFLFLSNGSAFSNRTGTLVPSSETGSFSSRISPGTYPVEILADHYDPRFGIFVNSTSSATYVLTRNDSQPIYTPLYATGNAQLANISSPGSGTPEYILPDGTPHLAPVFQIVNDYSYPVFSSVSLTNTTDPVVLVGVGLSQGLSLADSSNVVASQERGGSLTGTVLSSRNVSISDWSGTSIDISLTASFAAISWLNLTGQDRLVAVSGALNVSHLSVNFSTFQTYFVRLNLSHSAVNATNPVMGGGVIQISDSSFSNMATLDTFAIAPGSRPVLPVLVPRGPAGLGGATGSSSSIGSLPYQPVLYSNDTVRNSTLSFFRASLTLYNCSFDDARLLAGFSEVDVTTSTFVFDLNSSSGAPGMYSGVSVFQGNATVTHSRFVTATMRETLDTTSAGNLEVANGSMVIAFSEGVQISNSTFETLGGLGYTSVLLYASATTFDENNISSIGSHNGTWVYTSPASGGSLNGTYNTLYSANVSLQGNERGYGSFVQDTIPTFSFLHLTLIDHGSTALSQVSDLVTVGEAGLTTSPLAWTLTLDGTTYSLANASTQLSLTLGTYPLVAKSSGFPTVTMALKVSGSAVYVTVLFVPAPPPKFGVTFEETGLPTGTRWSVTLGGATVTSVTPWVNFTEPNGTYYYSVGAESGYRASPVSGTVTVSGVTSNEAIVFTVASPPTYVLTLTETGLPSGTSWSVTLNGTSQSSTTSAVSFTEPNGTYSYTIGGISGWTTPRYSGSVTLNGTAKSIVVPWTQATYPVTLAESGLPSGTAWSVTLSGATGSASALGSITFHEPNGTHAFTVGIVAGYTASPSSGTVTVNGAAVTETITFRPPVVATYAVTFTESGLPSGTSWSVTLNGATSSSTTPTTTFTEPNGTYSFTVPSVTGYSASPSSGSVTLNGAAQGQSVSFASTSTSSSSSSLPRTYVIIGVVVAAVVAGVAITLILRSRRR